MRVVCRPQTCGNLASLRGSKARPHRSRYETTIQRILADRNGHRTWAALDRLERCANEDGEARAALCRLEALFLVREYFSEFTSDAEKPSPEIVAQALDAADVVTQRQVWKRFSKPNFRPQCLSILRHSHRTTGWKILGLPPCIGRGVGRPCAVSLEHPDRWKALVNGVLGQTRRYDDEVRVAEYRLLYHAYKTLQSGRFRGRVSGSAIYLDLKDLEQSLAPKQWAKAQNEVKNRLLGGRHLEPIHPRTRARSFLGSLKRLPGHLKESSFYHEFSTFALSKPRELNDFASLLKSEIEECSHPLSKALLPKFSRALARVQRTLMATGDDLCRSDLGVDRRAQLRVLRELPSNRVQECHELEHYRTGLTVNGYTRNYT